MPGAWALAFLALCPTPRLVRFPPCGRVPHSMLAHMHLCARARAQVCVCACVCLCALALQVLCLWTQGRCALLSAATKICPDVRVLPSMTPLRAALLASCAAADKCCARMQSRRASSLTRAWWTQSWRDKAGRGPRWPGRFL